MINLPPEYFLRLYREELSRHMVTEARRHGDSTRTTQRAFNPATLLWAIRAQLRTLRHPMTDEAHLCCTVSS